MTPFAASNFFFETTLVVFVLFFMVKSHQTCDIEVEKTLRTLLTPQGYPTIQLQALRRSILRRFHEALDKADKEDDVNTKRSISSLAQWGNLPNKRSLEALARAGYFRTLPTEDDEDPSSKRSIESLLKSEQLPPYRNNESKRGIESLARNGDLFPRRNIKELIEEIYDKRNSENSAQNLNFPSYGKRYLGTLARAGQLHNVGKREANNAAETRDALNNNSRRKRLANYDGLESREFSEPVYQGQNGNDYEELISALMRAYSRMDKRFLGSDAKTDWPEASPDYQLPEKRHIGALARLGWLPSLRYVRRFSRSPNV